MKPFYYFHDNESFCFASEQKALANVDFISASMNEQAAYDFLVNSELEYSPQGLFNNITELFPGNYFELDLKTNSLKVEKYFSLEVNTAFEKFDKKNLLFCAKKQKHCL